MSKKPVKKPKAKLRPDVNETAFRVLQEATGEAEKRRPPGNRTEKAPDTGERVAKKGKE